MALIRYSSVSLCRSQSTVETENFPPSTKTWGVVAGYPNGSIADCGECAIKSHDLGAFSVSNKCSLHIYQLS